MAEHDDRSGRGRWLRAPRGGTRGLPPTTFETAVTKRRAMVSAQVHTEAAPGGGARSVNWTPIGPLVMADGQASGHPPVGGRVEGIAVGPNGTRVYVGAADGGVWYSEDGGENWEALDDALVSSDLTPGSGANSLSVGALAATFGANRNADEVFVATGEHVAGFLAFFGVGIRVLSGGVWTTEATNLAALANLACTRVTIDPDDGRLVLVATSQGLFQRPLVAPRDTWTRVVSPAFTNAGGVVTDVVIAGQGAAKQYFVAFGNDGVYSSPDLVTWAPVAGGPAPGDGRIVLAAGEDNPAVVYAFCQSTSLFRLTAGLFQAVGGVPANIFGSNNSGRYNIVLAADPSDVDTIYLGGSIVWDEAPPDLVQDWTLALFRGRVTADAVGNLTFPFNAANTGVPSTEVLAESNDPTFVGRGIHPDGQTLAFARSGTGAAAGHDGTIVWVGCDGGAFRSTASGALGTFVARNRGVATAQQTFLANHPFAESVILAGTQDNGSVRWTGGGSWYVARRGDGGGVAIDPNNPLQMLRQFNRGRLHRTTTGGGRQGKWTSLFNTGLFPPRTAATAAQTTAMNAESARCRFYAPMAVTPPLVATSVLVGTDRVWLSQDFGLTWVTLPTNTNPYALPTAQIAGQDAFGGAVVGLAFPAANLAYACTAAAVFSFAFAAGAWVMSPLPAIPGLNATRPITSIAVGDNAGATLYATVGGVGIDHCWFIDTRVAGAAWQATGLADPLVDVPAHAVTIDPSDPDQVFAGTDVGVFTRRGPGPLPAWTLFSQGLPEAAVHDLKVHVPSRVLRAATHGRGMWEIELDAVEGVDGRDPDVYLRMNVCDNGRRLPGADGGPDPDRAGVTHGRLASPDIRVRRALSTVPMPAFPGRRLRLTSPTRMQGPDVRRWQQRLADRGWVIGVDGDFGRGSDRVCREFQALSGLTVDGIVGRATWAETFGFPALVDPRQALDVEMGTSDDLHVPTGDSVVDATGVNDIFVIVRNRAQRPVLSVDVTVLLLLASAVGGVPTLPADYANRIRARDASAWTAGTGWVFANPATPYGAVARGLHAAAPQSVRYSVDFSTTGLAGNRIIAVAFVSVPGDELTAVDTDLPTVVMADRRIAAKRFRLVPLTP